MHYPGLPKPNFEKKEEKLDRPESLPEMMEWMEWYFLKKALTIFIPVMGVGFILAYTILIILESLGIVKLNR
jgi:hypothetical protein